MSLISILDERAAIVDLRWLSVPTVRLLEARGFTLIEIEDEERDALACNVLASTSFSRLRRTRKRTRD